MSAQVLVALISALLVAIAVCLYLMDRIRRREALYRWASMNGYRILRYSQPVVESTPFPLTPSKSQHVFKITVADSSGAERTGDVRLGSMWSGLASSQAEVRWE